jgi:hypothetical protein
VKASIRSNGSPRNVPSWRRRHASSGVDRLLAAYDPAPAEDPVPDPGPGYRLRAQKPRVLIVEGGAVTRLLSSHRWLLVGLLCLMSALSLTSFASPATATHVVTALPVSGDLWNARIPQYPGDGGTGEVIDEEADVTVRAEGDSGHIAWIRAVVDRGTGWDGRLMRPEHHWVNPEPPTGLYVAAHHTFTFQPGDLAAMAPTRAQITLIADDGAYMGQSDFYVNVPRDTYAPFVTATHGNLVAGWSNDVAEVAFDATDGTGIREARLIIDGTVRSNATYACDYTKLRPCENLTGASLTANVANLASGTHTWQLEVVDAAGNVARTPSTGFEIDWIRETIVSQMSLPDSAIVSVGDGDDTNVLNVGMTNPTGLEATDLKARFGDAIAITQEEELESLAAPVTGDPVPGADTKRDPMLAGVHITNDRKGDDRDDCTSGFMFKGRRNDPKWRNFEGVITAGHCLFANPLTWEWKQGGALVGTYVAHRYVNGTFADAGFLLTCCGTGRFRAISNRVFLGAGAPTAIINEKAPGYSGEKGDTACISGAYGGYSCGVLEKVGRKTPGGSRRGIERTLTVRGKRVVVRNVYAMRRDRGSCKEGDSGAPVFRVRSVDRNGTPYGTALGIAFSKNRNGQLCYFAQQTWVEWELNVHTYLGG